MYELCILAVFDPKTGFEDREVKGHFEFETSSQAELRALRYLTYCPNDIVMLVEPGDITEVP